MKISLFNFFFPPKSHVTERREWSHPVLSLDLDGVHDHRGDRIISSVRLSLTYGVDDVHSTRHLTKHGVRRLPRTKPVEKVVMYGVDKKLRTTAVGATGVGHRQRAWFIRRLIDQLIGDVSAAVALDRLSLTVVRGVAIGTAGTGAGGLWILATGNKHPRARS